MKLPEIDFMQSDEVLREQGTKAGTEARKNVLERRFRDRPQQGDEFLVKKQTDVFVEARTFEQNATSHRRQGREEQQERIAHGKAVYLNAYAIALRHEGEGVLDHSTRLGGHSPVQRSNGNYRENPLFKFFVRDWWRSLLLLVLIAILIILSGDSSSAPLIILGFWVVVEILVASRRLLSGRPSRRVRNHNQIGVGSQQTVEAEAIDGNWRPGIRYFVIAMVYAALVVITGGLALLILIFLIYPWWATNQNTRENVVNVEGEMVEVKYWIRRSRVWLITHTVSPRALARRGRLTRMFISQGGKLYIYQQAFAPFLILTPDPDSHNLSQFIGGSKNVTIDRASGVWNRLLGLAAPFGRIEITGPSRDEPLVLEGVIDPKRVGDLLASSRLQNPEEIAPPVLAVDQNLVAAIVAAVVATRADGGPENNQ